MAVALPLIADVPIKIVLTASGAPPPGWRVRMRAFRPDRFAGKQCLVDEEIACGEKAAIG
jgi:hypothetical protein